MVRLEGQGAAKVFQCVEIPAVFMVVLLSIRQVLTSLDFELDDIEIFHSLHRSCLVSPRLSGIGRDYLIEYLLTFQILLTIFDWLLIALFLFSWLLLIL